MQQREIGAPTLCDSMDGTGEHYAKWNKPGGERQIPYDLTYKWNLINKTNKQAKYNQRRGNKKLTVTSGEEDTGESRRRGKQRNMNRGLMGTDNEGGLTVGVGGWAMKRKAGQL